MRVDDQGRVVNLLSTRTHRSPYVCLARADGTDNRDREKQPGYCWHMAFQQDSRLYRLIIVLTKMGTTKGTQV